MRRSIDDSKRDSIQSKHSHQYSVLMIEMILNILVGDTGVEPATSTMST